jgi:hypothetical protein
VDDSALPERVISRSEWQQRVVDEEKPMFLLMCVFTQNDFNAADFQLCAEFKHDFYDKIKPDHPDAIFAIFDTALNDDIDDILEHQQLGMFYFAAGKSAKQHFFADYQEIGLGGQGDPLMGAVYVTTFKDWAIKVAATQGTTAEAKIDAALDTSDNQDEL